ncbi:MAG: hypothetical protein CMO01_04745 [Thalassobius sp.]|nr:hypothetical protein [Thalassovita sp.]
MKFTLKSSLKYLVSLVFGIALFWWLYREKNYQDLYDRFQNINMFWVAMSGVTALISHWARAYRWKIALKPFNLHVSTFRAMLAVMVGYFANMIIPRIGEFARSGILKRTDDTPVNISFGAIIAERAIDLIILMLLTGSVFLLEFDKVGTFVLDKLQSTSGNLMLKVLLLSAVGVLGLSVLFILYKYRARFKENFIYNKGKEFLEGIKEGILSIKELSNSDRVRYVALTLCIWVMYFLMSYLFFFSLEETSSLGVKCGLTTLIMGGIGMAIPTPGGMGSYHIFVSFCLTVYGLEKGLSSDFALLMHSTQSLIVIILGAISLVITMIIILNKKESPSKPEDVEANIYR